MFMDPHLALLPKSSHLPNQPPDIAGTCSGVDIFEEFRSRDQQNVKPCKNMSQVEIDPSLSHYFASVKKKIHNNQLQNQEKALKQVVSVFVSECQKSVTPVMKIVMTCLNVICLIMHYKKPFKKELVKHISNLKFAGALLRLDVKQILQENKQNEKSLCYLLQICYEGRLFDKPKSRGLIEMYKKFVFQVFNHCSDNSKMIFNSLRIIDYLQNSKKIHPSDYFKYDIIKTIRSKTIQNRSGNPCILQLSYRLILNTDNQHQAMNLFKELTPVFPYNNRQSFYKAIFTSQKTVSSSSFNQLLQGQIFQTYQEVQPSFYKVARRQIKVMQTMTFLKLIQSNFIETLASKWKEINSNNQVVDFVSVLVAIQDKSKELLLYDSVKEKILILLPFLTRKVEEEQNNIVPEQY